MSDPETIEQTTNIESNSAMAELESPRILEPIIENELSTPMLEETSAEDSSVIPHTNGIPKPERNRRALGEHTKRSHPRNSRRPGMFTRFVAVAWSGEREPAGDLLWAEAHLEGEWVVIEKLERVRTRREIVERIFELESGLVALDFNFSFPQPFFDFLSGEGISDWRTLVRTVRDDLKKNMDDGARLWLDRMGRYREAFADSEKLRPKFEREKKDRGWNFEKKAREIPIQERMSSAERFRRTDLPILPLAGANVLSTMQIGYNRLTERYEFNGNSRGRASLLGMAMLGQLLDTGRDDLSIWPFMELKKVTVVETLPWIFTEGKRFEPKEWNLKLANYEDAGWEIPEDVHRSTSNYPNAQQTLITLISAIKTENRLIRNRFPIRFYTPLMYQDTRVQLEGWTYGMNYRLPDKEKEIRDHEQSLEP